MARPAHNATEQEARNAAVEQVGLGRRQVLVGVATFGLTGIGIYLGVAATRDLYPFSASAVGDPTEGSDVATVGELAEGLTSSMSEVRQASVRELANRATSQRQDRVAAQGALTAFLQSKNRYSTVDPDTGKAPPEVSLAFRALGQAGLTDDAPDLRYANLAGVEVSGVEFKTGVPLYGANLDGASITDSLIGSSNVADSSFKGAWLGGCTISGWNLVGAQLQHLRAPGTRFAQCTFAGADLSGADFSTSTFAGCDFTGDLLSAALSRQPGNLGRVNAAHLARRLPALLTLNSEDQASQSSRDQHLSALRTRPGAARRRRRVRRGWPGRGRWRALGRPVRLLVGRRWRGGLA